MWFFLTLNISFYSLCLSPKIETAFNKATISENQSRFRCPIRVLRYHFLSWIALVDHGCSWIQKNSLCPSGREIPYRQRLLNCGSDM
jgi:hypothetical protein